METKKKTVKKLSLSRETLVHLKDERLAEVVAGGCTGLHCETNLKGTCCNAH